MSSALASIGLRARSETRLFLVVLARKFKARYSSVIHLYVDNAQKTVYCRGLGGALKAVFTGRRHNPAADCADGERFLRAVISRSFDLRGYDLERVVNLRAQSVQEAPDALECSLHHGAAADWPVTVEV